MQESETEEEYLRGGSEVELGPCEKINSGPAKKAWKGKEGRRSVRLSQQLQEHERKADEKWCHLLNVQGMREEGTGGKERERHVCHLWSSCWVRVKTMPSGSDPERERKEGRRCVKKLDLLCLPPHRHAGLQPELVPHGDVSDWLLHTHTGCKSSQLFTAHFSVKFMCFICLRPSVFFSALQDGILFGMVGAYDWDGGVLKEGTSGRIMPPREAFESEFPLELKNHAAYLGTYHQWTWWCWKAHTCEFCRLLHYTDYVVLLCGYCFDWPQT